MSSIPAAREELEHLASILDKGNLPKCAERIRWIIREHMIRKVVKPAARANTRKMTPEMAQEARAIAKNHPDMTLLQIANSMNVNPGRVSEAIGGLR